MGCNEMVCVMLGNILSTKPCTYYGARALLSEATNSGRVSVLMGNYAAAGEKVRMVFLP